ncbi:small hydrophilic protein [Streptomyces venezuelae]|uniref:Small hydrophilic protein n=2 Tax=Streptomyces venezuelae TaxID=54571 RepID=A0A5P2DEW1_STRVZ|nr:small hydrophilic protein [Streptomyces venezuelae]
MTMNRSEEREGAARNMRDKAQELEQEAVHTTDPAEHDRLMNKARRIREKSERVNGPGAGTMDPM